MIALHCKAFFIENANFRLAAYLYDMLIKQSISKASPNDIPEIIQLVNNAYRGEKSRQGWTHEADLIDGDLRTDFNDLEQLMQDRGSVFLKYIENGRIAGSVYLQKQNEILYLGMLSVDPTIQAKGIGKQLLAAAEDHARNMGCKAIEMTVISKRMELVKWYKRHGYNDTGIRKPFQTEERFGYPREPLEFIVLVKSLIQ